MGVKICIKKKYSDKLWEDLILSYICPEKNEKEALQTQKISGLQMAIKPNEVVFSLWVKKQSRNDIDLLKDWIRTTLGFSKKINIDYKPHPIVATKSNEKLLRNKVIYI